MFKSIGKRKKIVLSLLLALCLLMCSFPITASAAAVNSDKDSELNSLVYNENNYKNEFASGRVIVGLNEGSESLVTESTFSDVEIDSTKDLCKAKAPKDNGNTFAKKTMLLLLKNKEKQGVLKAIDKLKQNPHVAYAEPDYLIKVDSTTPNDPDFNRLYGMNKIGAPQAWDITTGSSNVVVGVIDTGIDYNHPDLKNNMWTNPGEIPGNGRDDDGNGYVDDVYGWDFANNDNDPMDDHYHGTHVAGTIAGIGNNGIGVAGVCWRLKLSALKFLDSSGSGWTSDAVAAINYANAMGIPITNNSWGGGGYSQALSDAIAGGGLFVAAAGNDYGNNNDSYPVYPASYTCENIVSVAATDSGDNLAWFSNIGKTSVDLAAPGVDIWSCAPGNGYQYLSGTSMATPHVVGAAALLKSYSPSLSSQDLKNYILQNVDKLPQLNGKVASDGRLNVYKSIPLPDTTPPTVPTNLAYTSSTETSISFGWTASTDNSWVAGYEVYRNGVKIGSTPGITFTSIPLTPNKNYTFTVRAYDAAGNYSAQSAPITASTQPDTVLPTAPTGLTATNITETKVTLTWAASTDNTGIKGYKLYCNGSLLANPSSTTITPGWRIPGATYVFTVTAIDLGGNESLVSEPLSVIMLSDTQKPSTPTGLTVTGVTQNSVSLSWTASTDNSWVAKYEVYRDGIKVGSPLGTVFTSTPLVSGRTCSFTVKACDVAGNVSDESETVWATTN